MIQIDPNMLLAVGASLTEAWSALMAAQPSADPGKMALAIWEQFKNNVENLSVQLAGSLSGQYGANSPFPDWSKLPGLNAGTGPAAVPGVAGVAPQLLQAIAAVIPAGKTIQTVADLLPLLQSVLPIPQPSTSAPPVTAPAVRTS